MTDVTDRSDAIEASTTFESASRPRISVPFGLIEPLFALADVLVIVAAGALGGLLYHGVLGAGTGDPGVCAGLGLVASLAYVLAAHCLGLYRLNDLLQREYDSGRIWTCWSVAIPVLAVILFLFKSSAETSRGAIVCLFVLGGIGLVLARRLAKRRLRAALMTGAIRGRRAIVIGTKGELASFGRLDLLVRFGLDEVGRVLLPPSSKSKAYAETVLDRVREAAAEEIVLALSWSGPEDIQWLLDQLRAVPLPVRLLPDRAVSTVLQRQTSMPQRLYMVELQRTPLTTLERG